MPSPRAIFFLFIVSLFALSDNLSIDLVTPDNIVVNMYTSGQYNSFFVDQTTQFNCSMDSIYTYAQTSTHNEANTPYIIQFSNIPSNLSFTLKSYYNNRFNPTLSASSCSNVTSSSCNITVLNNCPSDVGQFNYFTIL